MKPTGKSIGGYRGSTGGLQEDAKSSFGGFEGRKVGGKGSWRLGWCVNVSRVHQEWLGERNMVRFVHERKESLWKSTEK